MNLDVAIVGCGAAGLATAIFAARRLPEARIAALDGAKKLGAKILVSGGGRCNVTNVRVTPADYWGGPRKRLAAVLKEFSVERTLAFFRELGVTLHEEEYGKLFPDSHSARTVLTALLDECRRRRVTLFTQQRVTAVDAHSDGSFRIVSADRTFQARTVVLATGGLSLPRTGSDGGGYELAGRFGHTITPTTPALDPLVLSGEWHAPLSGIAHDVLLTVHVEGEKPLRLHGPLLWTHFGASGPVALNASRHFNRARIEGRSVRVTANLLGEGDFETADRLLIDWAAEQPRRQLNTALAARVPQRVAEGLLDHVRIPLDVPLSQLPREARRRLARALAEFELPVSATRGYKVAEVTAGGVPLDEIDVRTMESRLRKGLFLVGEMLDVDGRLGGFNFQWAWSGAYVAARGIEQRLNGSNPNSARRSGASTD